MTGDSSTSTLLEDDINRLKHEVDALQVEIMAASTPWHRQATTLIALGALLFSLGTTVFSYFRTAQQDLLAARIELRGLIEKLSDIPERHARMLKEYDKDAMTAAQLSSIVNNRNLVLARQAEATVLRIEESWAGDDTVLAVEFTAVAAALANSLQFEQAALFHQEAAKRATDPASAAGALRSSAGVALARQDVDSMRSEMAKAQAIFGDPRFRSAPPLTQNVTNATTELQWAQAELQIGDCPRARSHVTTAGPLVLQIPESPIKTQLANLLVQLQQALRMCTGSPS